MSNTASDTVLKITSRHNSLTEAVQAAGLDLSYNQQAADERIAELTRGYREAKPVNEVFVCGKEIFYIYQCDIKLLNKFEPFHSCLHDGPLVWVSIEAEEIILKNGLSFPKTRSSRKLISETGITVCSL